MAGVSPFGVVGWGEGSWLSGFLSTREKERYFSVAYARAVAYARGVSPGHRPQPGEKPMSNTDEARNGRTGGR